MCQCLDDSALEFNLSNLTSLSPVTEECQVSQCGFAGLVWRSSVCRENCCIHIVLTFLSPPSKPHFSKLFKFFWKPSKIPSRLSTPASSADKGRKFIFLPLYLNFSSHTLSSFLFITTLNSHTWLSFSHPSSHLHPPVEPLSCRF